MTLSDDKITEIFYQVDTFYIHFHQALAPHILGNPPKKKPKLSVSEVISLMILFHHSGYRTMNGVYIDY
ncbi:MAG: IS982 family transposase, partial [Candidatus Paceibacterota bacterium]